MSDMSKKAEYLKQMGWTQELIEHFMVEGFKEDHSYGVEDQSFVVESSSVTLKSKTAKANTNMTLAFKSKMESVNMPRTKGSKNKKRT